MIQYDMTSRPALSSERGAPKQAKSDDLGKIHHFLIPQLHGELLDHHS